MKHFWVLLLAFCMLGGAGKAQVSEDFADGNFIVSPVWTPNVATDWTVDAGQLRSNAATTNYNFYISTPSTLATTAQWELNVNLQFNTSSTNYVDIYLTSQEANLQSTTNSGYFVRIGGTPDEVSLYKLTAGTSAILIDGLNGRTNASNNTLKIKVIRDGTNLWTLQTDLTGTGNSYQTEGSVTDNSFSTSAFFGFRVQQSTASFFNKHFFDDIQVQAYVPDTTPPTLLGAEVLNNTQLLLTFSEDLKVASAQNTANYVANNSLNLPTQAQLQTAKTVLLTYTQTFGVNITNILLVKDIEDLAGNALLPAQVEFTFIPTFAPQYNELIITEIMADPRGSAQPLSPLPDAEYIEIYNRSNKILNLKDCTIEDESGAKVISNTNFLLYPNRYVLLCEAGQVSNFQGFGRVVGIAGFPSLTNSGERLTLKNGQANLLFSVRYTDAWHTSTGKKDGGWSLEMKDVNNPCVEKGNWASSTQTRGGTPATANSLQESIADLTAPTLIRTEAIDANTVRLTFNEKMDSPALQSASYQIDNGITVQSQVIESPTFTRVLLTVAPALQPNQTYTLTLSNAKDCNQNALPSVQVSFGLATTDAQGDIGLNEILFNPPTGGVDFVELYNASNKYINLKDWKLANIQDGIIANQKTITTDALILPPKAYLLLTTDTDLTQANYPKSEIRNFFEIADIPSYSDDEGTAVLINATNVERERFDYKDDFHFPLLDDEEGVSLERISPTLPANNRNSWYSASERVGFATPGYLNSQSQTQAPQDNEIQIVPSVFTPDGDGQDDFANIQYKFGQGGKVMTAIVYNRQGQKIKTIAENQLLGTEEGVVLWDGTTQAQALAPQGYYLVIIKVFDTKGVEKTYKKTVAIGIRF